MGLHAIEAAPKDGNPVFPLDQDTGDTTTVHWVVRHGVALQREGVPIAVSSTNWRPGSKSVEGSRGSGSLVARASVAAGACVLWLFIGAVWDKGLCGESNGRASAFVAPAEKANKIAPADAMQDKSSLVSPAVETTVVEQKQMLERGGEKIDNLADRPISIQRSDAAHGKAAQAPRSAPAWERKQPLQFGQEWGKGEVFGCALTSSLREELDAVRSAAEVARIEQKEALDQERDRANALARELSSLWAELDAARLVGLEAVRAAEAEQALEQERGRADALARELISLQAEFGTVRAAGSQAAEAESKQKQILEQERDGLARELTSLRGELAAAQVAGSQAAETESKQKLEQALGQERDKREALARELTSLQAELDTVRTAGSQAVEAESKQKQTLEQERGRADGLARELAALQTELGAVRAAGPEATQAAEAENKQRRALEQERDGLARELTSLKGELAAAQAAGSQAAETESKQKQTLEQALGQERDKREALARELTSLQAELDTVRAAGSQAVEAESKQKQTLEQERGRADGLARELVALKTELSAVRAAGPQAAQAAEAESKQRRALEQERDGLARELTSLKGELAAAQATGSQAAETESKQKQALGQERDKREALARELTSLQAELDTVRAAGSQAVEAESKQKQTLEQERDGLTRELTSLKGELAAAQAAGSQAAETESKQKQTLEQALRQERDKREPLARELTSLRAELDTARAAHLETALTAEAAKIEQQKALKKEREKVETLSHELASARKEAEERSARLAAAHAEELRVTETNSTIAAEHKLALANERDRADALARELTSVKNELEANKQEIAALRAPRASPSRVSVADSSPKRTAESSSRTIDAKGRSPEQISVEAVASTSGRSSGSELPRPKAPSTAREAPSESDSKIAMTTERASSVRVVPNTPVDEQRLLSRANTLLRQSDISGARPLLEHALEHGSARAAFMLAETYDTRVLQSWRVQGISGDVAKARELYEQAQAGGIEYAKERIEALK